MDDLTRITLRLPADMAAALKALAERGDRSLHAQIIRMLRQSLEAQAGKEREDVERTRDL